MNSDSICPHCGQPPGYEAIHNQPEQIPEWLKKAIEERIQGFVHDQLYTRISELKWVLSQKPPEQQP